MLQHVRFVGRSLLPRLQKWLHLRQRSTQAGIVVSGEVEEAVASQHPVVALESTIISHGMPFPHNLDTALRVEDIIRCEGAVPATIAVLNGRVHVGLTRDQIHALASKDEPCIKVSRRDLPYVLAKGMNGGTTVSGTMVVAQKVGIPVFVTGGIGGVHRGAENTLDISADLTELGRTPVTVVSAGVKSILDVGKTLEYLETQGVCVAVLGSSGRFPDFFTQDSGFDAPYHIESPADVAVMMQKRQEFGLMSGMLIAVPIPQQHEAQGQMMKQAIAQAVQEAEAEASVCGRDVTPFILKRVAEITGGESLKSNIALVENNAKAGAQIAVEYAKMTSSSRYEPPRRQDCSEAQDKEHGRPVVIGGSIVDFVATVKEPEIKFTGMTHRGSIRQSYGGVGRNLGDCLARLHCHPFFISAVGDDDHGPALVAHNPLLGREGVAVVSKVSTAVYCVVLDRDGEALFGVGDMSAHSHITPAHVGQFEAQLSRAPLVLLDGNLPQDTINYTLDMCANINVPVWYEPTDVQKATKPWVGGRGHLVAFTSPNLQELGALCTHLGLGDLPRRPSSKEAGEEVRQFLGEVVRMATPLLPPLHALVLTLGHLGFMVVRRSQPGQHLAPLLPLAPPATDDPVVGVHFAAPPASAIVSVSGAGDCLAAGFVAGMLKGRSVAECGAVGVRAAHLSLTASPAVPSTLTTAALPWHTALPSTLITPSAK